MKKCILVTLVFILFVAGCQIKTQSGTDAVEPTASPWNDSLHMTGRPATSYAQNILANSGFEKDGLESWVWLDWSKGWAPFELSTDHAYEGRQSLHLPVLSTDNRQTVVWGGVQEVTLPDEIPECIEGYYYVEHWSKEDWKQYLQLVVIDLSHPLGEKQGQAQLRYIISGCKEPPLSISNAQYLFIEKERSETPVLGKWTRFSVNPREDFVKSWQYVPQKGSKLRVLFEGRYDYHKSKIQARADVYFDNLYFGPATPEHCPKTN